MIRQMGLFGGAEPPQGLTPQEKVAYILEVRPAARARIASFDGTEYELDFGSERWTTVFDSLVDDTFRPEAPWLIRWPGHKGEG